MRSTISGHTKLFGLLGSPVEHSISPLMHNEAFRILGLDHVYLCFDVGTNKLKQAVDGLKTLGIKGFNVTMPDKNLMCELVDELSPAAKMIGAVNTVLNVDQRLIGYNTDGIGYIESVKAAGFSITGKKLTILGAGGAATAICVQAALDGASQIDIFSRKGAFYQRAMTLVDTINSNTSCNVRLFDITDTKCLGQSISDSYLLTNATSVGMSPNTNNCVIDDFSMFRSDLIVSDIIYNPRETLLLSKASEQGCKTFNGLNMLLYQGAKSFEIWTNKEFPINEIKEKISNFL